MKIKNINFENQHTVKNLISSSLKQNILQFRIIFYQLYTLCQRINYKLTYYSLQIALCYEWRTAAFQLLRNT